MRLCCSVYVLFGSPQRDVAYCQAGPTVSVYTNVLSLILNAFFSVVQAAVLLTA